MEFEARYSELVQRLVGRRPSDGDGIGEAEIRDRERELGVAIPKSLRQYYRVVGKLAVVNKEHNRLYDLRELKLVEGHLLFMEENQEVVHWGFPVGDLDDQDPEVWQKVNCEPAEWYSEGMRFSEFIKAMWEWQAGIGDEGEDHRDGFLRSTGPSQG